MGVGQNDGGFDSAKPEISTFADDRRPNPAAKSHRLPVPDGSAKMQLMTFQCRPSAGPRCLIVALCGIFLCGAALAQSGKVASVHAKKTLYPDGTKSESVMDLFKHQVTETTYDTQDVIIARKVYLLNENGLATQGIISDGVGHPIANVKFFYDELGRLIEQRLINMQGEVFRRIIQSYDPDGKPLKPKAYNYNVKAPTMRTSTTDFTQARPASVKTGETKPAEPAADGPIHIKPGQIIKASPKR